MRSPTMCPRSTRIPTRVHAHGRPAVRDARVAAERRPAAALITPVPSPRWFPCAHSPRTEIALASASHRRAARLRLAALPDATVLTVLAVCAAAGKLAEEHTRLGSAVSAPLVAMGTAMVLAAASALPAASGAYDVVWDHLMPLAVALSLLGAPIDRTAVRRGSAVLVAFAVGALGTVAGTFAAYSLVGHTLGPHAWKVAACLCASYVGGSLNYAATAQALGLGVTPGGQAALAAGMAADNLAMAAFLAALALVPAPEPGQALAELELSSPTDADTAGDGTVNPTVSTLACAFAAALLVLEIGRVAAAAAGFPAARMAVAGIAAAALSAAAATAARRDSARRFLSGGGFPRAPFAGASRFGATLMLLFFATLGARADPNVALANGAPMFAFIAVQLATHFAVVFLVGGKLLARALDVPLWATLTASNACVGGPATAAAAAVARGWSAAVQPAVLAGTVGYVVGTPLAVAMASALRAM